MMKRNYLEWLYFDILNGPESLFKAYRSLLETLLDIPFRVIHPMDENRFKDGLELREDYICNYHGKKPAIMPVCTVLEALIALAFRMEKDIMAPMNGDFDCFRWFWGFIENLELTDFDENDYDEGWIRRIIDRFLDREYDENGKNGGIFPLHFCKEDARDMELWSQMNEFLCENY